ncbi:hypothetical protein [Bartonella doshiae]|uniref:hypothetical protein n=1 Tax=Bartonella doshiae TaxID=33044 RepID=UPI0009433A41|nr:hypothetical protein [Bartonella doshiae]
MFFLRLYCKKEKFLPLTTWLLLSSFGMLLVSNLGTSIHLTAQSHGNNVNTPHTLDSENKYTQLNITTTINKEFTILRIDPLVFFDSFQSILILNILLMIAIVISTRLHNPQTQYFANKRAPPYIA